MADVGVDLSHQLDAAIGHLIGTVDNQFPEVLDTDEVLVVHQPDRATLLLQFIQLSIDRFEETIEATEEKVSVRLRVERMASNTHFIPRSVNRCGSNFIR